MRPTAPAPRRRPTRPIAIVGAAVVGLGVIACGAGAHHRDGERPPVPIVISASIDDRMVTVSPTRLGAGPITLIITNQSSASQEVTLRADTHRAPAQAALSTGPISPRETASVTAQVTAGAYALRVGGSGVQAARLVVGHGRPSSQNDLLTP
jgi:hypothetical protein